MTHVLQDESLTLSCCLNPFPNSQPSCEALNPTYFSGCVLLQKFERACSMSQWSWADCMRMRHLAGSPPEQRGLNPGKVSLNFTRKRVESSVSLLQFWPIIKRDGQKQEESARGLESQTEELHSSKERRIAHPEGRAVILRKNNQLLYVSHHQPRGEQFLQFTSTSATRYRYVDLIVVQLMRTLDN